MNSYPLRALTVTGDIYVFTVMDIPMRVTNSTFILANKPNSPILNLNGITRGMDIPDLFEGDIIDVDGEEYLINYMRGFRATGCGKVLYLTDIKDYKVVGNIYTRDFPVKCSTRKRLIYKYRDSTIKIEDITGVYRDYAIVRGVTDRLCPVELQQDAGFTLEGTKIFYGDVIDGEILYMHRGRPVINRGDKIYDITRKILEEKK